MWTLFSPWDDGDPGSGLQTPPESQWEVPGGKTPFLQGLPTASARSWLQQSEKDSRAGQGAGTGLLGPPGEVALWVGEPWIRPFIRQTRSWYVSESRLGPRTVGP